MAEDTSGSKAMGIVGRAANIANLTAVGFLCMVLWWTLAYWIPQLMESHREDMKEFRMANERQVEAMTQALKNNTQAISELSMELRVWQKKGEK